MSTDLKIGITDGTRWHNYEQWFLKERRVKIIKLSHEKNNLADLKKCDGIVLSGGEDVHPKYYGKPEWIKKKQALKLDVNLKRDIFEMKIIDGAVKNHIPLLGICRGLQIVNVYFKGSLIPDLRSNNANSHSSCDGVDGIHNLKITGKSCLASIVKSKKGMVNSAHHQSAKKIGKGLKVTATDSNKIVEAIEWKNPVGKPFLLLVQWHPERMKNQSSRLSKNIRNKFIEEVRKTKTLHQ